MSTRPRNSKKRPWKSRSIAIASIALTLSACSTTPSAVPRQDLVLVTVACPMLVPLNDATFGATTRKLKQVADQYYECRKAALATVPVKP
jgi:starvation-inducible outer membrane lipoprotein